jgi:glycosyltransferase involved in cell wall biosynthesis
MRTVELSVIVPAYKKASTIITDLTCVRKVLKNLKLKSEIICVVDGNSDKTYENAKTFSKDKTDVKVIGYKNNRGKGFAVRAGMSKSHGKIVAFIDSGMDIDPNSIPMLLEHFRWYRADIVVASKRHPASKVEYPWQRRLLSLGYQQLVRLLFGLSVRDTQVGLKCYRREVLTKVLPCLVTSGFAFDIEILAVANSLGFTRIFESPVELKTDFGGSSVLTGNKLAYFCLDMFIETLKIYYRLNVSHFYSKC